LRLVTASCADRTRSACQVSHAPADDTGALQVDATCLIPSHARWQRPNTPRPFAVRRCQSPPKAWGRAINALVVGQPVARAGGDVTQRSTATRLPHAPIGSRTDNVEPIAWTGAPNQATERQQDLSQ
jgi:hypothetical protein